MKQETIDSLRRYADHRIETGGFLRAVLENDLMEAFGRADLENTQDMVEILRYIYNKIPMDCHGSPENVKRWLSLKEPPEEMPKKAQCYDENCKCKEPKP